MKSISKQLICISIILLLIGVSYTSAIRVENKTPLVDTKVEDDCGCNEVSDADIVKLEKQLDRLERYSKLLLVLSKYNPELKAICEDFSNQISILTNINNLLENESFIDEEHPIICSILWTIAIPLAWLESQLLLIMYEYPEDSILYKLAENIQRIIGVPYDSIVVLLIIFGCTNY